MREETGRRIIQGSEIEVTTEGKFWKRGQRGMGQKFNLVSASISRAGQECQTRIPVKNTEEDPLESKKKRKEESAESWCQEEREEGLIYK